MRITIRTLSAFSLIAYDYPIMMNISKHRESVKQDIFKLHKLNSVTKRVIFVTIKMERVLELRIVTLELWITFFELLKEDSKKNAKELNRQRDKQTNTKSKFAFFSLSLYTLGPISGVY